MASPWFTEQKADTIAEARDRILAESEKWGKNAGYTNPGPQATHCNTQMLALVLDELRALNAKLGG